MIGEGVSGTESFLFLNSWREIKPAFWSIKRHS
jgi:hypothetical protein